MQDQPVPGVYHPGTDVAAVGFLGIAAAVSGVQAGFLLRDETGWRAVQAGRVTTWHHVPYLESLLALVDLAVLALGVLVLLTTFAERRRHGRWELAAWAFIAVAAILEWRLLGLRVSMATSSDFPLQLGPDYSVLAHEALAATVMCAAALAAAVVSLYQGRISGGVAD